MRRAEIPADRELKVGIQDPHQRVAPRSQGRGPRDAPLVSLEEQERNDAPQVARAVGELLCQGQGPHDCQHPGGTHEPPSEVPSPVEAQKGPDSCCEDRRAARRHRRRRKADVRLDDERRQCGREREEGHVAAGHCRSGDEDREKWKDGQVRVPRARQQFRYPVDEEQEERVE